MTTFTWTLETDCGAPLLNCDGTPLLNCDGTPLYAPGWTDVGEDVLREKTFQARRGMNGAGPTDRVASPGMLTVSMDNGESNSAGLLGYYAPEHANARVGFVEGMRMRLKLSSGGTTRYVFHGRAEKVQPSAGRYDERETQVQAADFMEQLAIQKLKRIPVQTGKRTDQLLALIVANLPIAPLNTDYDTAPETFAYALQSEQDEKTYAITAVQKAVQSDLGYAYVIGNDTDGETFVYESRQARQLNLTSKLTLDNEYATLQTKRGADAVYNDIHVPVTPTKVNAAATTVLATSLNEIQINAGESKRITMRFVDPSGAGQRISGIDLVAPEADTDWKFSSISGNNGNDLNANLTAAYASDGEGGNAADVIYTNTGGTTGYLQAGFQIRGKGVYQYDAQEATASDTDSRDRHGNHELSYSIPYQSDFNTAQDFCDVLLMRNKEVLTEVQNVSYYAEASDTLMAGALSVDIGDRITLIEEATGLEADFFVNGVQFDIVKGVSLKVTYVVERVKLLVPAGILDDAEFGLLDSLYLSF